MWTEGGDRGSALLTVLWLSAALAAIAFSLANTVRGETERTSTEVDGLRAYYIASGAVERAALELLWSVNMGAKDRPIPPGSTAIDYRFPSGDAHVDFIPETAKLNVNFTKAEELVRLMLAMGVEPPRAVAIAQGIAASRGPAGVGNPFAPIPVTPGQTFPPLQTSFQEIEDLLLVPGVTPDIFYGTYIPGPEDANPRLVKRAGLVDCLSVYGATDKVDANTADAAVLAAVGLNPYAVVALLERRRKAPLTEGQLSAFLQSVGGPLDRLRVEGNTIVTIRATARLRMPNGQLSDLKRGVAAQVKYMPGGYDSPIHILRWHDTAWSN